MGRLHAVQQQQTVAITQLSLVQRAQLDSTARLLGVKPEQVKVYIRANMETKDSFSSNLGPSGQFASGDSFFNISGDVDSLTKTLHEKIVYSDLGTIVGYSKPKKILGITYSSDDFIDISFNDPETHITGLTNVSLQPYVTPKRFSGGPQAGVMYNGKWVPYVGVGITYNLIKR